MIDQAQWPQDMGLETFWRFFELEVHDTVLDLEDAELSPSPLLDSTE